MKIRQEKKHLKIAKGKILRGDTLTKNERKAFNRYMENWLGDLIVSKIKAFLRSGKQ